MPNLRYRDQLYLGDGIKTEKLDKLKKKLKNKPIFANVYLITLSGNPSDQLDIYQSKYLAQKYYDENPLFCIGIAKNYDDALYIVQQIAGECYARRGDARLREYLMGT